VPKTEPLVPLLDALNDLVAWFQAAHVTGVVIGGVAASLLGRPRVTRDVDAMVFVSEAEWAGFLSLGAKFGFVPRRADAIEFAKMARVLLVQHGASGIDVDVVFGALPFEEEALAKGIEILNRTWKSDDLFILTQLLEAISSPSEYRLSF
jgi:hypothetical protein